MLKETTGKNEKWSIEVPTRNNLLSEISLLLEF